MRQDARLYVETLITNGEARTLGGRDPQLVAWPSRQEPRYTRWLHAAARASGGVSAIRSCRLRTWGRCGRTLRITAQQLLGNSAGRLPKSPYRSAPVRHKVARKSSTQINEIIEAIVEATNPGPPQRYPCQQHAHLVNNVGWCDRPVRCANLCGPKIVLGAFGALIFSATSHTAPPPTPCHPS